MLLFLSLALAAAQVEGAPATTTADPTKCVSSWSAWSYQYQTGVQIAYNASVQSTLIYSTWPSPVPTSTFCDGIPRLMQRQYSDWVTSWYTTTPSTDYYVSRSTLYPEPTCTVNEKDCIPFISSYSSALSSYSANGYTSSPISPPCTTLTACPTATGLCSILLEEPAKMYYWPVTVSPTDLCAKSSKTIAGTPTIKGKPNTAVVDGMTFTSPYAYLSVATIQGFTSSARFNQPCGLALTNAVVRVDPTAISTETWGSQAHNPSPIDPRSFDLVTLNWPVRTTASCTARTYCSDDASSSEVCTLSTTCKTPTFNPYNFNPYLVAPTKVIKDAAVSYYTGFSNCEVSGVVSPTWIPITTLPGDPRFTSGWETPTSSPYFPTPSDYRPPA